MFTDITAKEIKRLLLRVYKKLQSGEITESRAQRETFILNSILKSIEITDIEERLDRIETLMTYEK